MKTKGGNIAVSVNKLHHSIQPFSLLGLYFIRTLSERKADCRDRHTAGMDSALQ